MNVYCLYCRILDNGDSKEAPSEGKIMLVQAAGGIIAGATASCITTPLDTIKTRLQVSCIHGTQLMLSHLDLSSLAVSPGFLISS